MGARIIAYTLVLALAAAAVVVSRSAADARGPAPGEPPTAPELLGVDGSLTWRDNSDNEDGFHVEIEVNGVLRTFLVGANVTSFEIPREIRDQCGTQRFAVVAFNGAGEATSGFGIGRILECPGALLTATPPAPPILPPTGTGPPNDQGLPYALYSALASVGVVLLVLGARRRRRKRYRLLPASRNAAWCPPPGGD